MDRVALGNAVEAALQNNTRFASFTRVGNLRWVSETHNYVHQIFEFQAMKGDQLSARWGWSIGFVPILKGRNLRWKRTASKAEFDLCIDPVDPLGKVPAWSSFTPVTASQQIICVAGTTFEAAASDMDAVNGLEDLINLFRVRSRMEFRRFSLSNYVQTDLAWGLAYIATGQEQAGQERIDAFCTAFGVPRDAIPLKRAEAEARLIAAEMKGS